MDKIPFDKLEEFFKQFIFENFYTRNGMEIKTRKLLKLAALTTLGSNGIEECIKANLKLGNDKEKLYEAIVQCIPYVGFPQCLDVIEEITKR